MPEAREYLTQLNSASQKEENIEALKRAEIPGGNKWRHSSAYAYPRNSLYYCCGKIGAVLWGRPELKVAPCVP